MHDPAFADGNAAILKQDRWIQDNPPDRETKIPGDLVIARHMLDKSRPIMEMIRSVMEMIPSDQDILRLVQNKIYTPKRVRKWDRKSRKRNTS